MAIKVRYSGLPHLFKIFVDFVADAALLIKLVSHAFRCENVRNKSLPRLRNIHVVIVSLEVTSVEKKCVHVSDHIEHILNPPNLDEPID